MKLLKKDFPKILKDNDRQYVNYMVKVIESTYNDCELTIYYKNKSISFLIRHFGDFRELLLTNIVEAHNIIGLNCELSSYKDSSIINFNLVESN